MGVTVKIVQGKGFFFKKNLKREDVSSLWEKACVNANGDKCYPLTGLHDEFYRMKYFFLSDDRNSIIQRVQTLNSAKEFVLFDRLNYGSGITLWFENNNIFLRMPFPVTLSEIYSFYNLIELICKKIGTTKFYRDNENYLENINDKEKHINQSIDASVSTLKQFYEVLNKDESGSIGINGALNPISLNKKTIEDFEINLQFEENTENKLAVLKKYESYMHNLQNQDLFYGVFKIYQQQEGEINAYMSIAEECDTIVPLNPNGEFYLHTFDTNKITNYFAVLVGDDQSINYVIYSDFIEYIKTKDLKYYDASHIIVYLSSEDIKNFSNKK